MSASITFTSIQEVTTFFSFYTEIPKTVFKISGNDLDSCCQNGSDLLDYRNRGVGVEAAAAKGVGKALNSVDDVLANPNLLQGKSLEQVQSVLGNSKNWVNDVMRKSSRAEG